METVLNPKTKRQVKVGNATYRKLVKEGVLPQLEVKERPKRTLTEEQKEKMRIGREKYIADMRAKKEGSQA